MRTAHPIPAFQHFLTHGYTARMRKRSRIMEAKRLALLEMERKMTPEQRLEAYVQHSRLVMEIYHAGVKDRETVGSRLGKR